jgi:AraC-like DNA-binding protein
MPIAMVSLREVAHAVEILDHITSPKMVDRALRAAGLNRKALQSESGFLPYYIEAVIFEFMARALGDPHLTLRGAQAFDYSVFGAYSKYVLGGRDLKTAIIRGRRALPLTHPGSDVFIRTIADKALVCFKPGVDRVVGHQQIQEGSISVLFNVFRHFMGDSWRPDWVEITSNRTESLGDVEEIVGAEVRNGASMSAIAFPVSDLDRINPVPQHPKEVVTLSELPLLMGVTPPKNMSDSVSEVLRSQLVLGDLSEDSVAGRLLISRRKLQRMLKAEGTSFREIRDRFIENRAHNLLLETDLTIDEIAHSLNFSEPNSFRRAFRKWSGLPPNKYRAARSPVVSVGKTISQADYK